jgi:hypothetical protein
MRSPLAPWHLLPFAKAFAHHLMHGRLHEPGGTRLAVAISLAIVRDQVAVVPTRRAACFHGFAPWLALRIRRFEGVDERLEVLDFVESFVEMAMPQPDPACRLVKDLKQGGSGGICPPARRYPRATNHEPRYQSPLLPPQVSGGQPSPCGQRLEFGPLDLRVDADRTPAL